MAVSPDHFIGGKRVASEKTFEVRSPLDWDWKLADVARGDALTADMAVSAAVEAFPGWAAMGPEGRGEALHRLADLIDENIADLAIVECVDMAMLLESLEARVIHRGAENFRNYADLAAEHTERVWSSKGTRNRVQRMPAGPAVIITPWNAPWILSTWKMAPAVRRVYLQMPEPKWVIAFGGCATMGGPFFPPFIIFSYVDRSSLPFNSLPE